MEIEKVIFVIMLLVGIVALVLTVSLIISESHSKNVAFSSSAGQINYPSSSNGQVFIPNQVNARNYCVR